MVPLPSYGCAEEARLNDVEYRCQASYVFCETLCIPSWYDPARCISARVGIPMNSSRVTHARLGQKRAVSAAPPHAHKGQGLLTMVFMLHDSRFCLARSDGMVLSGHQGHGRRRFDLFCFIFSALITHSQPFSFSLVSFYQGPCITELH